MDIVLGTQNKAKIYFYKKFLLEYPWINIKTLADYSFCADVEESGSTLEDNALIKACFYGDALQVPVIAADAGMGHKPLGPCRAVRWQRLRTHEPLRKPFSARSGSKREL